VYSIGSILGFDPSTQSARSRLQSNRSKCWFWQRPALTLRLWVNIGSIENYGGKCQFSSHEVVPSTCAAPATIYLFPSFQASKLPSFQDFQDRVHVQFPRSQLRIWRHRWIINLSFALSFVQGEAREINNIHTVHILLVYLRVFRLTAIDVLREFECHVTVDR